MLGRTRRTLGRLRGGPPRTAARAARSAAAVRRAPQRATPPDAIGKPPLLTAPGFGLGAVVMIRNEAPYLEEWLAYHHALGVDHFFIYDNGSTDALHEVIEPWVNHGLVTLTWWPLPGGQQDAYSHAVRMAGHSFEWLAFFDVDEFVVPLVDEDIPTLLARFPEAADVRMPRVDFGFSGQRVPPEALTIEAYCGVANVFGRDPSKPPRVKTVLRPRSVTAIGIHTATVADLPVDAEGRPVPSQTIGKACHRYVQLNHYYTRSFEEFEAKRFRGSGTGRIDRPAIPFDLPTLAEDTSAHRFVERTRAMIEHIRSLAPSPYHYGSQLRLAQFPHFNDLGLFAEFAVANTVAEEPELRREPRLRVPNLYAGTGFLGDITEHDHVPVRGDLSGSMHLGPLLGRCRGRLERSWAAEPEGAPSTLQRGTMEATEDGWSVAPEGGEIAIAISLEANGRRRCHALGFVLRTTSAVGVDLELEGEPRSVRALSGDLAPQASSGDPARGEAVPLGLKLEAARTYAGVVELEPLPRLASTALVQLRTNEAAIRVHDLFVISYG